MSPATEQVKRYLVAECIWRFSMKEYKFHTFQDLWNVIESNLRFKLPDNDVLKHIAQFVMPDKYYTPIPLGNPPDIDMVADIEAWSDSFDFDNADFLVGDDFKTSSPGKALVDTDNSLNESVALCEREIGSFF